MEDELDMEDELEFGDMERMEVTKRRKVEEVIDHNRRHKVEELPPEVAALVVDCVTGDRRKWRFGIVSNGVGSDWKRCMEASSQLVWIFKPSSSELVDDEEEDHPLIRRGSDWTVLLNDLPVDVILFEGKGPMMSHPIWKSRSVKLVAWTVGNGKRCAPRNLGWVVTRHAIGHAALGGSLNMTCRFMVATPTPNERLHLPRFRLQEPVSTGPGALECMINRTETGPQCPTLMELNAQGTLDALVNPRDRDVKFVVPCVFSKSGWVRRRLTSKEWLRGFDCPEAILKELSRDLLDTKAGSIELPFKARFHLIRSIGRYLDDSGAAISADTMADSKRPHDEDGETESFSAQKRLKLNAESSAGAEEFDAVLVGPSDFRKEELATRRWLRSTTIPQEHYYPSGPTPLPTSLRHQLVDISNCQIANYVPAEWRPKDEMPPELLHPFVYDHQDDYPEEERNLKATKSDDAAIPVHLWDERVRNALNLSKSDVSDRTLQFALNVFRSRLLRRWKRRVAQGFWF